jgi:arsenate reductase (thioredoxin)
MTRLPAVEFDVAVTMGCPELGDVRARRVERWDFPAPKDLPLEQVRLVRDQIEQRVRRLLASLSERALAWAR